MSKSIPIAAYARTNGNNSKGSFCGSIKDQLSAIRSWAKFNHCCVVNEYKDESVSGFTYNSVNLTQLVNDVKGKQLQIKYIVVCSNSRISRNQKITSWFDREIKLAKIKLVSLSEIPIVECMSELSNDSFLINGFNGVLNEIYSRNNSKKSALKLNEVAKQGFFTGGAPPYGYQPVTVVIQQFGNDKERKVLDLHPKNARIVKEIFKLCLSENSEGPLDTNKIALYLNLNNLLKNGKKWTAFSVRKLITSTLYMGKREYGRNRTRNNLSNEIVVIPIPPIVSEKDFYQVQHKLTKIGK